MCAACLTAARSRRGSLPVVATSRHRHANHTWLKEGKTVSRSRFSSVPAALLPWILACGYICPAGGWAAKAAGGDCSSQAPPWGSSLPGPHVARIQALGDNEWLHLGPPQPDPDWGRARGRSWSTNQPAAPNLGGAFVFGEGVHAYVKPDGHYMNDLWFYEINGHRWICLYPGIDTSTLLHEIEKGELQLDERGLLVDRKGQPLPPLLIHAYGYLAYDPEQKQLAIVASQFDNYFTTGPGGVFADAYRLYTAQRQGKSFPALSPFFYDAMRGRWQCHAVEAVPRGGEPWGGSQLVYVSSKRQFFWVGTSGAWHLDLDKRTWVDARPHGTLPTGIDHCACYDPIRDRIYYYTGSGERAEDNFYIYDVQQNAWSRPQTTGAGPAYASSYESIFTYDVAADALVIIRLYSTEREPRQGVYVYEPQANAWARPLPLPAHVAENIGNGNFGFYDPGLNAYFCHFANDSQDDGTMWVYRCKKSR